jgi:adenine deaminase
MVREGSIRRDLEEISKIRLTRAQLRRLILVTDGVQPQDLMEKGYMEHIVQKAIDCGFDPITAIQMATLNVAEHFGLDTIVGGIAPGKMADMLVVPDARTISPEIVVSNGRVVAQRGETTVQPRRHIWSNDSLNTIHLPGKMKADDFKIAAQTRQPAIRARIIEQVTDLVTKEAEAILTVVKGEIAMDVSRDIIKVAAVDRTHRPGKTFTGFLKGYGLKSGAVASSAAWDVSDIIVAGTDENDMAAAVNRIHDLQGGAVLVDRGAVLAEVAMPVLGIAADAPLEETTESLKRIQNALTGRGVPFADALLTLITLTGAAIPFFRICEEGLVRLKTGETVGLIVD